MVTSKRRRTSPNTSWNWPWATVRPSKNSSMFSSRSLRGGSVGAGAARTGRKQHDKPQASSSASCFPREVTCLIRSANRIRMRPRVPHARRNRRSSPHPARRAGLDRVPEAAQAAGARGARGDRDLWHDRARARAGWSACRAARTAIRCWPCCTSCNGAGCCRWTCWPATSTRASRAFRRPSCPSS